MVGHTLPTVCFVFLIFVLSYVGAMTLALSYCTALRTAVCVAYFAQVTLPLLSLPKFFLHGTVLANQYNETIQK